MILPEKPSADSKLPTNGSSVDSKPQDEKPVEGNESEKNQTKD
jgi:hypothetical protein